MSRTYAHVPYKFAAAKEGHIEHDHVNGECIVYDPKQNFLSYTHIRRGKCKKVLSVEYIECIHTDTKIIRYAKDIHHNEIRRETLKHCPEGYVPKVYSWDIDRKFVRRSHHETKIERDNSIPCACDSIPHLSARYEACTHELSYQEAVKHVSSYNPWDAYFHDHRILTQNEERMSLRAAAVNWNSMTEEERADFDWDDITKR